MGRPYVMDEPAPCVECGLHTWLGCDTCRQPLGEDCRWAHLCPGARGRGER
jgi:hypothetical protein